MKFKRITIIAIIIFIIININNTCLAKYVFEYTEKAISMNIDRTPPILKVEYYNKEHTNTEIEVKVIANEKIQKIDGWDLLEDEKTLVKIYNENINEKIIVKDLSENQSEAKILIDNIDKEAPNVQIIEIQNTNKGYEKYANQTHEVNIKLKIFDENKIVNNLKEFVILVGTEEKQNIRETKVIEKNENYIIYEIKLTNITGNGRLQLKIPEDSFEDMIGNKMSEKTLDTEIEIDNISPEVQFNSENLEDGKVLAKIISNEKIRNLEGWQLDESKKINSKQFISDIKYEREVKDLAGNISTIEIKINNSTFLGFEYMAHISEVGWIETENNFVGTIESGNLLKIESLGFRTGEKVEKDFLNVSAYMYTHWGEGSRAESQYSKIIYNYGYNPITGYKTMLNSELVNIKDKKYIQLGGEGINQMGLADINGNNPIPSEIDFQYNYGVSGIKLDLKNHNESSIVYQIFFNDTGWLKTCKNGEEAMRKTDKPIEAVKIAVIPTSEIEFVIMQWDKNIGTYNLD